ncbi:hypothetical protein [Desulfosporosinus hippei]|uniref:Uncharacterized protein n=1 Tax=Desulfosporosinus hippei DSM 8344 TaxID=1121419 RepID=A0A1G8EYS3_9FIRM|nr:hypothetical protein [Desulfosporosinus hippei]SDH75048.1 hypothetical protein SAMN05443529_11844 [Desulfosporosinus hippei DSM 8344]
MANDWERFFYVKETVLGAEFWGFRESKEQIARSHSLRFLALWMLKELRQPLGNARCEPGRNWPFSIGIRFTANFTKVFFWQLAP